MQDTVRDRLGVIPVFNSQWCSPARFDHGRTSNLKPLALPHDLQTNGLRVGGFQWVELGGELQRVVVNGVQRKTNDLTTVHLGDRQIRLARPALRILQSPALLSQQRSADSEERQANERQWFWILEYHRLTFR